MKNFMKKGVGGHSGVRASYKRIEQYFYWPGIQSDRARWIAQCEIFQTTKHENVKSLGLLQPLTITEQPWIDIAMDFITSLPNSRGYEVIWVVTNRYSILHLSTSYHPQSDGCTERINQCLEQYLRSMCGHSPKQWANWLAMTEWWFNTTYDTTLKTTPYKVLYGQDPKYLNLPR